jgi:hypothetical protein
LVQTILENRIFAVPGQIEAKKGIESGAVPSKRDLADHFGLLSSVVVERGGPHGREIFRGLGEKSTPAAMKTAQRAANQTPSSDFHENHTQQGTGSGSLGAIFRLVAATTH